MPNTQTSPALMPGGTIGIFGRTHETHTLAEIAGIGTEEPKATFSIKSMEVTNGIRIGGPSLSAGAFNSFHRRRPTITEVNLPAGSSKEFPSEIGEKGPSGIGKTAELALKQKATGKYNAALPKNQNKQFHRTVDRKG